MRQERGIVAIFVVIFSSLLLTLIAVSFTRLMILEQQQSLDNDLSQSALDSARAGVEDGKRVLRLCEASGNPDSVACREIRAYRCTTVHESGIVQSSSAAQTMIISNGQTTSSLDQASGR